jgi:hypothetical protein
MMWKLNINDDNELLLLQISDELNLKELSNILKAIYIENNGESSTYNRFADLTGLKNIKIDTDTASSCFNKYRCMIKPDRPVKISLFVPQKYIAGFPYLYRSMSGNDLFEIEISDSLDECAKYLSVDRRVLQNKME